MDIAIETLVSFFMYVILIYSFCVMVIGFTIFYLTIRKKEKYYGNKSFNKM